MCGVGKDMFFGLVRVKNSNPYSYDGAEYEIHFINDSENPAIIKEKEKSGFKTYDDNVVMRTPKIETACIIVEPHSHVLCFCISESDLYGANQYQTVIETDDSLINLSFYLSGGAGFMGSLIPCLNLYGRVIRPQIKILN